MDDSQVLKELVEQSKWLRLLGTQALRPMLTQLLTTERDRTIFEYSDGNRGAREVAELASVTHPTVLRLWQEWIAAGVCVEAPGHAGRAQHLIALSSIGVAVKDELPQRKSLSAQKEKG